MYPVLVLKFFFDYSVVCIVDMVFYLYILVYIELKCWAIISVVTIIVSKFLEIVGDRNHDIFPLGAIFFHDFNTVYEQHSNCIFSVHAICMAYDYFIIVTHTLHLSAKKHIIMCFSDKRLLLLTLSLIHI